MIAATSYERSWVLASQSGASATASGPEAALSPQSQLALLAMLFDMVRQDAQFVIATHSPLVLAYPGARIYAFDDGIVRSVGYDELEHVRVMRDFLRDSVPFLRQLDASNDP